MLNFRVFFLVVVSAFISACGGSGGDSGDDVAGSIYPDCTGLGDNEISGCWISERCELVEGNGSVGSARILLRYRDADGTVFDGHLDVYGTIHENGSCTGTPTKVELVASLSEGGFKVVTGQDCTAIGGTFLQAGCTDLQWLDDNGDPVNGYVSYLGMSYISNQNRLCFADQDTGEIDLSDEACYTKFTP